MTAVGRQWSALPAAHADLARLKSDDERLAARAVALLDLLAERRVHGEELGNMASYGDLSDCRKFYFGATGQATHRIVYRELGPEHIEVIEAVASSNAVRGMSTCSPLSDLGGFPAR